MRHRIIPSRDFLAEARRAYISRRITASIGRFSADATCLYDTRQFHETQDFRHANPDKRQPGKLQFRQFSPGGNRRHLPTTRKRAHLITGVAYARVSHRDETRTAAHLQKGPRENGFTVDVAYDGFEGLELARAGRHALIVIDVMSPALDGWAVLEELRRAGVRTPVLFLTARDRVEDRIKGLQMGADHYLVKPYAFSELLARTSTILKRGSTVATVESRLTRAPESTPTRCGDST